jgi:type II secretory pathway component PulM
METDGVHAFTSTDAADTARGAHATVVLDPYPPIPPTPDGWIDDRLSGDEAEPSLAPPAALRRRRRRRLLVAYVVVSILVVTAVVVGVQANRQLTRTDASLASIRGQLRQTTAQVATARSQLATAVAHSEADEGTLRTETAQLAADQGQLAKVQADVQAKGVSIGQLDLCLSGVEQALNQIAVGDQPGAAATLNGVSANCQGAEPSG